MLSAEEWDSVYSLDSEGKLILMLMTGWCLPVELAEVVRGQQEAEQQGQDPEQVEDVVTVGSPHLRSPE